MINITINAETGAEARGALLELLGLTGETTVSFSDFPKQTIFVNEPEATPVYEPAKDFIVPEPKKRRSKAEIEAEKVSVSEETAKSAQDIIIESNQAAASVTIENEIPTETTVTKEDLQKKAVELGRVGKKELCRAVLQKHGADSISTADKNPLKLELYAIVLDEFNKL